MGGSGALKRGSYTRDAMSSLTRSQTDLPTLFKGEGLQQLRPSQKFTTSGYLEVFPRASRRKPQLLQQLESLLAEKLRLSEKLSAANHGAEAQSPRGSPGKERPARNGAMNMRLDAFRECFDAFINAFSTYRPLLARIKEQYDAALDHALKSEHENVYLRSELNALEQRKQRAVEEARAEANAAAATLRGELSARLQEAEERARAAESAVATAIAEADAARSLAAEATAEADHFREENRQLKRHMFDESSFNQRPLAGEVLHKTVGPLPPGFNASSIAAEDDDKPSAGAASVPAQPGLS